MRAGLPTTRRCFAEQSVYVFEYPSRTQSNVLHHITYSAAASDILLKYILMWYITVLLYISICLSTHRVEIYIYTRLCILSRSADSTKYARLVKISCRTERPYYLCNNLYIYPWSDPSPCVTSMWPLCDPYLIPVWPLCNPYLTPVWPVLQPETLQRCV